MRHSFAFVTVLLAMVAGACARDPKQLQITTANQATFLDDLGTSTGMTVEEVRMLVAYDFRRTLDSTGKISPVGKSVGQIIEEQRQVIAADKAKIAESERLATEARARLEAKRAELRDAILLSVIEKGFSDRSYGDKVTFTAAYQNKSARDIRAFRGSVEFADLFGKKILGLNLTIQDPVAAGADGTWEGTMDFNQFMADHVNLRNTELKDMKVTWNPAEILFADGSSIAAESK